MRDVLSAIDTWRTAGQAVAVATVVQTWGSSPRQAGAKMALTPRGAKTLLISLDYDSTQMNGPPFPVPRAGIEALFQPHASVRLLEDREVIATHPHFKAKGVMSLRESAYVLERR